MCECSSHLLIEGCARISWSLHKALAQIGAHVPQPHRLVLQSDDSSSVSKQTKALAQIGAHVPQLHRLVLQSDDSNSVS
jgi:hypothetical protein